MHKNFSPQFETLEERVLLSASPIDNQNIAISAPANQAENNQPSIEITEVLVIDTAVTSYDQIISNLNKPHLEIHFIDSNSDGIQQLSNILSSYKNIDALHIVSHGSEGNINLGNNSLNADKLNSYKSSIQNWSKSFTGSADILIYGCDVASNSEGQAFIKELSQLTGTDIAASDDLTGYQGDTELEYQQGAIEAQVLIDQDSFDQARITLANSAPVISTQPGTVYNLETSENSGEIVASLDQIEAAAGTVPGDLFEEYKTFFPGQNALVMALQKDPF